MSLRWRKSLSIGGRSLVFDVLFLAYSRWRWHESWSRLGIWVAILMVLTAATTAYTWWWFSDPRREDRVRRLRRERDERARLK
ncbi:hypothetical protein [Streptomyces sp. NBC_00448]|uniref:hypothetical protein n=1 Tax=Streptomyces sp. NBC_00448 TaxID=2903652 RepID=UPI002E2094EC